MVEYKFAEIHTVKIDAFDTVEGSIIKHADQIGADMIAMETHGRTGFKRFVMGNLSETVVNHAPVPVLIMKLHPPKP